MSMRDYLRRIQLICDQLKSLDHLISESMQISTTRVGLPTEYEHVVAVIDVCRQPYDLAGVTSVLLDVESPQ